MTVVPTGDVAKILGITLPDEDTSWLIEQALLDAEGAVVAYLHRPIIAVEKTLTNLWPMPYTALDDPDCWPEARADFDDKIKVLEATAETGGTFTVRFLVGLDVANDPELRRIYSYIRDSAVESLRNNPDVPLGQRRVQSVSAEGQSVSYANDTPGGAAAPGAPAAIDSLSMWKRRAAYMRPTPPRSPWPYASGTRAW